MHYKAIIAAAGLSSRMRGFKPLLCLGDSTIIDNVIANFRAADIDDIIAVTGYRSEILMKHLEGQNIVFAENKRFAVSDMMESVRIGIEAAKGDYDYVFITPVDVPMVEPETIRLMKECRAEIVRPSFNGHAGHPLMLSRRMANELLSFEHEDGIRGFLRSMAEITDYVSVSDRGILADADTPEGYRNLRHLEAERSGGVLRPKIGICVVRTDYILDPERAQLLAMIDVTGSISLATGSMHMSYTKGWKILNGMERELGYALIERHAGGEDGGGSELTERARRLLSEFREYEEKMTAYGERLFREIFIEK